MAEEVPTIEIQETQVDGMATQFYTDSMVNFEKAGGSDDGEKPGEETGEEPGEKTGDGETPKPVEPETGATQLVAGEHGEQALADAAPGADPVEEELKRQMAFLEEAPAVTLCKKCGLEVEMQCAVVRGCSEIWCRSCNAVYTMLQRNLRWPPPEFAAMSEGKQQNFFQQCAIDKQESERSCFSYSRVKDSLTKILVDETIKQKKVMVGGTYLPKSVYESRGYVLDSEFENRNPKQWSEGLQQWTFLLCETTISEGEIKNSIEKSLLESERQVKKRKAKELTPEEMEAVENKSVKTDATVVMDLV